MTASRPPWPRCAAVSARKGGGAPFDVWFTPVGREDYSHLRADLRRQVDAVAAALASSGCAAADYRLAGTDSDVGRICVVHLSRDWRLILGFPADNEVAVLLIGRHLRGARSIYDRLYRLLGVNEPPDERSKPPCCEDGVSPVDRDLVQRVVDNAKRLRRG
jgi:plasmid maintenance system killer protein